MTIEQIKQELNRAFGKYEFFPEDHHYECNGKRVGISVTTFYGQYENEFETEKVAQKVVDKNIKIMNDIFENPLNDPRDFEQYLNSLKYTIEEVLAEWKYKADFACSKGSTCHEFAQSLWSGEEWKLLPFDNSKEYLEAVNKIKQQAINFKNDYQDILVHIKDELLVGSEEFDIASAVDHLFYNKLTDKIVLVDYKTNSILKGYNDDGKNARYTKKMKVPLQHLDDLALYHYYIQLSIYKYLIEKYTDLTVDEWFIVYMSENNDNYEIIETPYLKDEVEKILEMRRVKNMNSIGVLIQGNSGTGKSTSLRNLPADETAIINVTSKPMPFKNKNGIKIVNCKDYQTMIKAIITTKKRIVVVDDSSYMMAFENFDKATNKGYDKFTTMAVNYYDLLKTPQQCDGEKLIYFITHEEIDENGVSHPKSIGKMLSQQLVIEGLFSIVLRALNKNGEYVFQTHNDGTSVCKSPMEMFEEDFVPNDLLEIDKIIREYYGFKPITEKLEIEDKKEEEKK